MNFCPPRPTLRLRFDNAMAQTRLPRVGIKSGRRSHSSLQTPASQCSCELASSKMANLDGHDCYLLHGKSTEIARAEQKEVSERPQYTNLWAMTVTDLPTQRLSDLSGCQCHGGGRLGVCNRARRAGPVRTPCHGSGKPTRNDLTDLFADSREPSVIRKNLPFTS